MRMQMQQNRRMLLVKAIVVVLALVIIWLVGGILGFSVDTVPSQSLATARQLWNQKGGSNYAMKVRIWEPPAYFGEYQVTVQDNKVIADTSPFPEEMKKYTVDSRFNNVSSALASIPQLGGIAVALCPRDRYTLEFDSQLGYISTFQDDSCQRGLLCGAISDCNGGFKVSDLHLIP